MIVPRDIKGKKYNVAVSYTYLKNSLTEELSKKLRGRGEISLMDDNAVWSYKSFVAAFKKRNRA